jgi:hypothetical protein
MMLFNALSASAHLWHPGDFISITSVLALTTLKNSRIQRIRDSPLQRERCIRIYLVEVI